MTVRLFVIGTFLTVLISGGLCALVVTWLDPDSSPWLGLTLFFLTLFLSVASLAALLGYGLRRILSPSVLPAWRLRPSLRQGIWLGLFLDLLLFLQLLRLTRWWLTLIIIILFLFIEFIFLSYDRGKSTTRSTRGREQATT